MLLLLLPVMVMAQNQEWRFDGVFPPDTALVNSAHGLAVDNDMKVWIAPYYSSVVDEVRFNPLYVYNDDGTEADFSPITGVATGDSTLRFGPITGLNRDHMGNILVSAHGFRTPADGSTWNQSKSFLIRLDASDGSLMDIADITLMRTETAAQAPNRAAVTDEGFIFVSYVFPGPPIQIYDEDLNFVADAVAEKPEFSRTLEVSRDGSKIYHPSTKVSIYVYESNDGTVFGEYDLVDSLGVGTDPGAIAVNPASDLLYASASGTGNAPLSDSLIDPFSVFGYDQETGAIVETLRWDFGDGSEVFPVPRSLAFSPDGETLYVGAFATGLPAVQKFVYTDAVSIVDSRSDVPAGYALGQNYPNPFNPTTNIEFSIPQASDVTLKVYDITGREIATLVNQSMGAGTHTAQFDAANVSSGMYIYRMVANGYTLSGKMMLVK
jgi:DNA-binding beta-propeller fold protein YncE